MKKAASSSRTVVDHSVMESGLRKAKLSVKRNEESSKKKKIISDISLDNDDRDLSDLERFFSDESDDNKSKSSGDDVIDFLSDGELSDDVEVPKASVHFTSVSSSDLIMKAKDQKRRAEKARVKKLFSVVEDVDVKDIQEADHEDPISELSLTNNAQSIRELFTIHQKRPSRGGTSRITGTSNNAFFQDHHKKFETGLQNLPDSFKMPKPSVDGNSLTDDMEELSLSYLAETIVDADSKSIEKIGSKLIDQLPHIEFRSRQQEEERMRECMTGERQCAKGDRCEGLYIGDTKGIKGFVLVSYETNEALAYYNLHKQWPEHIKPRKCVICERKEMNAIFNEFFAGNSERSDTDHPMRYVGQITYHNKVGDGEYSPYDVIVTDPNSFGKLLYPIVLHSRIFYRIVIRTYNGKDIRFYQQNTTLPSSFRVGRTHV
jgi:hypothetical protein